MKYQTESSKTVLFDAQFQFYLRASNNKTVNMLTCSDSHSEFEPKNWVFSSPLLFYSLHYLKLRNSTECQKYPIGDDSNSIKTIDDSDNGYGL